ncbi:MAG: hypothetical protein A2624_01395 [Gammaproteobacteria bacterium RIFCSPHIGHO2_01_FULL_42_8]|nr:MAG: hypothetical protein A2624_01395 [Gammaproteobacteria bacterium RIFCSPHIGHO2_01_FULL_42_8]OGT86185.1 MAG: hypothetical protein A3G86_05975 [Gammaproteobacteria bacterium RIFCSPLOWO2_12_FULL_42_18]
MRRTVVEKKSLMMRILLLPTVAKAVFSVILFFLIFGFGSLILQQQARSQETQISKQKEELEAQLSKEIQLYANLKSVSDNLPTMQKQYQEILKNFPSESHVAQLLAEITKLGSAKGLKFIYFKPEKSVPGTYFSYIPVKVSVVGKYHELGDFLSGVANLSNAVVTVNEFVIKQTKDQKNVLSLEFTATLYYALPISADVAL